MKKNYFKILNLPQKLRLDHNKLKKNYFNLLKENSNDPVLDPQKKKKTNVRKTELINQAYKTLKDRITRIDHLLELEGLGPANDNRAPRHFAPTARRIVSLIEKANTNSKCLSELKELHAQVLAEFSAVSIELDRLEKAWDEKRDFDILKKLKRKSAAFNYIKNIEQDIIACIQHQPKTPA